jgi:hypothetical protein
MRNYGQVRWLSVVLLIFGVTYVTYLYEKDHIARITAEILVNKKYTNSILEKVVLDAKRNNESILIPMRKSIENLQKKLAVDSLQLDNLQTENNRTEQLMDELMCDLEDAHTQITILQSSNDSLQRSASQLWASQKVAIDKKFKELDKKISYVTVKTDNRKLNFSDSLKLVFLNSQN